MVLVLHAHVSSFLRFGIESGELSHLTSPPCNLPLFILAPTAICFMKSFPLMAAQPRLLAWQLYSFIPGLCNDGSSLS
jgi:hypothetical protein